MKKLLFAIIILSIFISAERAWCPPPAPNPLTVIYYQKGNVTGTATIDYKNGLGQSMTLSGNCAVSWILPPTGFRSAVILKVTQHTGAHYNLSWVSTKWQEGLVPLITQEDGAIDFITCYLDDSGVYCTYGSDFH